MINLTRKKFYYLLIASGLVLIGCRFDKDKITQLPRTNHHDILPIAYGKVTPLDSLEKQDSNIVRNLDGTFKYVLRQALTDVSFDSLVKIPTLNLDYASKLSKIILGDITASESISLNQLIESGSPPARDSIRAHNGENYPFPPISLPEGTVANQVISFSDFKYIVLENGTASFNLTNNLSVPIEPYTIKLLNENDLSEIAIVSENINPGQTVSKNIDLKNKTINQRVLVVISAEIPGSNFNPVPIDTGATINLSISLTGLEARSGKAKIATNETNKLKIDQRFTVDVENGVILNKITFLEGILSLKEKSYLKQGLEIKLELPSIKENGNPLVVNFTVPGFDGVNPGVDEKGVDLVPYTFELEVDSITNIPSILPVTITGQYVADAEGYSEFNVQSDSIIASIKMENIKFNKVTGFFGNLEKQINNISPVLDSTGDLIAQLRKLFGESGYIALDSVFFKIILENSLGVSGEANLDLTSYNVLNNKPVNVKQTKNLLPAQDAGTVPIPVITEFLLDPKVMAELVSNLPKTLVSKIDVKINKDVPSSPDANFIYSTSKIKGSFEIEVPLSLVANDLSYGDTAAASINFKIDEIEKYFQNGELTLIINNTFPFKLDVNLTFLDSNFTKLQDLVLVPNTIEAGVSTTSKVTVPTKSTINIPVSLELLKNLQKTKNILFKATINSGSKISGMKLYSDYYVDFKVIADLRFSTDK